MYISCVNKCRFQKEGLCSLKKLPKVKQIEFAAGSEYCPYFVEVE